MRGWRRSLTVLAAGLLLVGLPGCRDNDDQAAPPPSPAPADTVALSADLPAPLTIGVVVSLSAPPGEGAEWRDAAEGAEVAVRRFVLGGSQVDLTVLNDKGTAQGATTAVQTLLDRGVAGIVLASTGKHQAAGLAEASARGVPVLLPYADSAATLPDHSWLTGPDAKTTDARLVQVLAKRGATKPFLVNAGGGSVTGLDPIGTRIFRAGSDPTAIADALRRRLAAQPKAFDSVVVSGPAELQAIMVRALRGARLDVPLALTPEALSPTFPATLHEADGSLSDPLLSTGLDEGDSTALQPSARGRSLAAYFSALQLTAADPTTKDFSGERPFTAVAGVADVRSHDAVVALVRAAAAAHSTDPAAVAAALSGLTLGAADGIAGPTLAFGTPVAVADDAVVALGSTDQSPGLRPTTAADKPTLYWFPVPT
ncbi:ABC transporter substrate-binding protein [uncultured Friedmanniella sp.]|uniref:ABC transporter substrate-binding protein n=1 Tax=uncultured Friedmanniella sp. TaxID=335381 RepID=UPI0035CA0A6D